MYISEAVFQATRYSYQNRNKKEVPGHLYLNNDRDSPDENYHFSPIEMPAIIIFTNQ